MPRQTGKQSSGAKALSYSLLSGWFKWFADIEPHCARLVHKRFPLSLTTLFLSTASCVPPWTPFGLHEQYQPRIILGSIQAYLVILPLHYRVEMMALAFFAFFPGQTRRHPRSCGDNDIYPRWWQENAGKKTHMGGREAK